MLLLSFFGDAGGFISVDATDCCRRGSELVTLLVLDILENLAAH